MEMGFLAPCLTLQSLQNVVMYYDSLGQPPTDRRRDDISPHHSVTHHTRVAFVTFHPTTTAQEAESHYITLGAHEQYSIWSVCMYLSLSVSTYSRITGTDRLMSDTNGSSAISAQ